MHRLFYIGLLCLLTGSISLEAQTHRILVGTYTENTSAEGVYLFSFDAGSADTKLIDVAPSGNPSFVIPSPDGTQAYAVNEFHDGRQGVSIFAVTDSSIALSGSIPMPQDEVDGADPCNILYCGSTVITSNYTGGSVTAFALGNDGAVAGMTQFASANMEYFHALTGTSFGTEAAHMHCAVLSPDSLYIFVTNLGMDCIHRFVRKDGIYPMGEMTIAWKHTGLVKYGPRHMVFSADGRFAYLLCELADKLIVFSYENGELKPIQTLTAYGSNGRGSADIHLSPDGRYLYTSHRLKGDGIAIFSVDKLSGKVRKAGFQPTGSHPRNFAISPDGRFLLCACRDDDIIEIYGIDSQSGQLTATGKSVRVGAPVCVQFVK